VRYGLADERVGVSHSGAILGWAQGQVNEAANSVAMNLTSPKSPVEQRDAPPLSEVHELRWHPMQ